MQDEERKEQSGEEEEVHQSIAAHLWEHRHKTSADADVVVEVEPESGGPVVRKMKNLWYHSKFSIIVIAFVLLTVAICFYQCASKPAYDAYILYAGPWMECDKSPAIADINTALQTVMEDYDGNGEKNVAYKPLFLMTPEQVKEYDKLYEDNPQDKPNLNKLLIMQNEEQLDGELMSGYSQICFVDYSVYATMRASDCLVELTEFADILPENGYDNYAVRLADTDFGKYLPGVQDMPEDTLLCFRRNTLLSQDEERNGRHSTLMRAILAYTVTAE